MKKVCFFAAGFLSITLAETAVSGDFVGSDNVIGVMAVQSDKKATIVAIPFKDCDGGDMRLSDFVKTANLAAGDQLYRYDSAKGGFDGWILSVGADGILFWEKCEKNFRLTKSGEFTSDDGKDADEERVAQGSGVWLIRATAPAEPFVFYLQGSASSAATTTVEAGKTVLLGNPTDADATPTITGMSNGDTIQFATGDGRFNTYTYGAKGWGYWDADNNPKWTAAPEIPAGIGFWYVSKGGAVTFAW